MGFHYKSYVQYESTQVTFTVLRIGIDVSTLAMWNGMGEGGVVWF